ncbi:hypothetical protein BT69DRAFT_577038 [Atractiella rhizophila]|nr:hypothetical protein BT69DRAFT_577038 [Atractiella rhizophila]
MDSPALKRFRLRTSRFSLSPLPPPLPPKDRLVDGQNKNQTRNQWLNEKDESSASQCCWAEEEHCSVRSSSERSKTSTPSIRSLSSWSSDAGAASTPASSPLSSPTRSDAGKDRASRSKLMRFSLLMERKAHSFRSSFLHSNSQLPKMRSSELRRDENKLLNRHHVVISFDRLEGLDEDEEMEFRRGGTRPSISRSQSTPMLRDGNSKDGNRYDFRFYHPYAPLSSPDAPPPIPQFEEYAPAPPPHLPSAFQHPKADPFPASHKAHSITNACANPHLLPPSPLKNSVKVKSPKKKKNLKDEEIIVRCVKMEKAFCTESIFECDHEEAEFEGRLQDIQEEDEEDVDPYMSTWRLNHP